MSHTGSAHGPEEQRTDQRQRSAFARLLEDWAAAIVANDPERISGFLEPDWTLVTPESGQISGSRFLAVVTSVSALTPNRSSPLAAR